MEKTTQTLKPDAAVEGIQNLAVSSPINSGACGLAQPGGDSADRGSVPYPQLVARSCSEEETSRGRNQQEENSLAWKATPCDCLCELFFVFFLADHREVRQERIGL